MLGILLIDKQSGMTSHDVVAAARRKLGVKRIGHSGTLDPVASGLLVLGVGPAARFLRYIDLEPKRYEGIMHLGVATTTYDREGTVTSEVDVSNIELSAIQEAAEQFLGRIEQTPPMYSAVKVRGERLYRAARAGKTVERQSRTVAVDEFAITKWSPPCAHFRVTCSGGTYVRSLAHDLGERLGVGAHLAELRRTAMGGFSVRDGWTPDKIEAGRLLPLAEALSGRPTVALDPSEVVAVRHGRALGRVLPPGVYVLTDMEGTVVAMGTASETGLSPTTVVSEAD